MSHKHGAFSVAFAKAVTGELDGRTTLAKTAKALRERLERDLGGSPSTQEALIIRRVVSKALRCETIEAALLEGKADGERLEAFYISLSNSLRRDLVALGLQRRQKDVKDLDTYLKERA